ncbi:MAG: chloramphenicol acetyltransferase [Bacteroidetes bacterium]|nr:MAG: chloramphenicol acetyltransferase [Bacteroidota bacterium]
MKEIQFTHPHRQKHFDFFRRMNHPHFNICAQVDITDWLLFLKANQYPFTPSIVYLVAKTANEIAPFRQRIRGEKVFEHEIVHPSFTVWTDVADVFSFCEVPFSTDFEDFMTRATRQIEKMKTDPVFEDAPDRDDYLFLSSIPWVSFTAFQHAMHFHPSDSVPRIVWGKYFEQNGRTLLPLSVQVHHAVVDGRHVGAYFNLFEKNAIV